MTSLFFNKLFMLHNTNSPICFPWTLCTTLCNLLLSRDEVLINRHNLTMMHQPSVFAMKSSCEVSFCFVISFHLIFIASADVLNTEEGRIDGIILLNRWAEPFHAYRKIPYAESPVGALRFRAPKAKKPWKDVMDCTHYGPMCMQDDFWKGMADISEDCLFLNVFTKNLPSCEFEFKELKPVIAFLHGGGFEAGSAIDYGPEYLMERE